MMNYVATIFIGFVGPRDIDARGATAMDLRGLHHEAICIAGVARKRFQLQLVLYSKELVLA